MCKRGVKKIFIEIGSVNFAQNLPDDTLSHCGLILENRDSRKSIETNCAWFEFPKSLFLDAKAAPLKVESVADGFAVRFWVRSLFERVPTALKWKNWSEFKLGRTSYPRTRLWWVTFSYRRVERRDLRRWKNHQSQLSNDSRLVSRLVDTRKLWSFQNRLKKYRIIDFDKK